MLFLIFEFLFLIKIKIVDMRVILAGKKKLKRPLFLFDNLPKSQVESGSIWLFGILDRSWDLRPS